MFTGSISFGRLAGASLRLHWSAILVATLLAMGLATSESDLGVLAASIGVVAFFASILGHELAHALVARRFGVATTSIDLWALGGVARLEHEPKTARAEGWIAAAGPLASILIGLVAYGAAYAGYRLDAPDTVVTAPRLAGHRQRRARRVQPAARCAARRRPHRARHPLGSTRQPSPCDA